MTRSTASSTFWSSPGRRRLGRGIALAAAIGALSLGCAPATPSAVDVQRLLDEARREGIAIEDPLALDDDMKEAVRAAVSRSSRPEERLRLVRDYLTGRVRFEYASNRSLTARQAWRERRGDCIAYTNLFIALARHVEVPVYFVHVREVSDFYEHRGAFFVSSHVAVGFGSGPTAQVLDFSKTMGLWREMSDWKLAAYRSIDDGAALALYYNNVAVDLMLAGEHEQAARLFRFWMARAPEVAEVQNNFGVLLNRQGRHAEALALLQRAIGAFPSFKPLYTNAMQSARGAHRPDVAADLAQRGHAIEHDDPFFIFARALGLYQDDAYAEAARELERARAAQPDSAVILAWLARAYLLSGRQAEGRAAFEELRRKAPRSALLRDLAAQFPELR